MEETGNRRETEERKVGRTAKELQVKSRFGERGGYWLGYFLKKGPVGLYSIIYEMMIFSIQTRCEAVIQSQSDIRVKQK